MIIINSDTKILLTIVTKCHKSKRRDESLMSNVTKKK